MKRTKHEYRGITATVSLGATSWSWHFAHAGAQYQNIATHQFGMSFEELCAGAVSEVEHCIDTEVRAKAVNLV